jgi:DNA-directed RNA polymerase specialized sigma24 family protein
MQRSNGSHSPSQEKFFRKFKAGSGTALLDMLEAERQDLYDYLMRMTGQVSRSADTVDEVFQSLSGEILETIAGYVEFTVDADQLDERTLLLRQSDKALDRALRLLPGRERESVLLRTRGGFADAEVGEIMGLSTAEAQADASRGLRRIQADCPSPPGGYEVGLLRLPPHPAPMRSAQATMNLSEVMQGIKTKPVGLRSPARIAMLVVLLVACGAWLLFPKVYLRLFDLARHAAAGSGR